MSTSRLGAFVRWLGATHGRHFAGYDDLYQWSVTDLDGFWRTVQQFLEIPFCSGYSTVLADESMPGARWFPGVTTNYVNGLLTSPDVGQPAIIARSEGGGPRIVDRPGLRRQAGALARTLRDLGVVPGDRVVGYLPNFAETAVAFYAAASLGAIWSSVGQEYEAEAAEARLGQLTPKVLIAADGYQLRGTPRDRREAVAALRARLQPAATILVPRLGLPLDGCLAWEDVTAGPASLEPVPVPFDHPLWVLFSSGTTGVPKGIVHSHGGVQVEMHKLLALHMDLGPGSRLTWTVSPSWVVWNTLVSAPLVGATSVVYDGSPTYPNPEALWRMAADDGVTHFGTSPGFLAASEQSGSEPGRKFDLSALRQILSTGAPLPPAASVWAEHQVGRHAPVISCSGGTDVVGPFVGGAPSVPVVPGEIPARCLGVALEAWDPQGRPLTDAVGELVVTRPMPSMPIRFWNDLDASRYTSSYFDAFPGVWTHGDWITVTSRGSVIVHGRSDSTLNRNGIRMGSADIYAALDGIPELTDALVIGAEMRDGTYWMPLFVTLRPGAGLDDALRDRIRTAIRHRASARHVPDEILTVPAIPYTRTGKKLEVPVKRILQGIAPEAALSRNVASDPSALEAFIELARRRNQHT